MLNKLSDRKVDFMGIRSKFLWVSLLTSRLMHVCYDTVGSPEETRSRSRTLGMQSDQGVDVHGSQNDQ